MSFHIIPWCTQNVPSELQKEMLRRKNNRSFNYQKIDGWDKDGGDWEKYKGPMTSWVRVCSNGIGVIENKKPGFVFVGGKGFYQTYGFKWNNDENQQILGYTPDGKAHTLEYDKITSQFQIHVPTPEIVRVETLIQKELFRRAWIHWKCFSPKQLEYMTPYFLVPGITMIIEFGWNHFNQNSLIDLTDEDKIAKYFFKNPYPLYNENVLQSNGNYDVVFGTVTNFEWSINGNQIDCMTEVTSKDSLYAGLSIPTIVLDTKSSTSANSESDVTLNSFSNIRKVCDSNFIKNLKSIASLDNLNQVDSVLSQQQLYQIITGGTSPMKNEYWRGIFYGRDQKNMSKSVNNLDYKWGNPSDGDFDKGGNQDGDVWVNMGFLVELLNRCFPFPDPVLDSLNENFFEVNIDESVIGAHPNHISCDGSILLIPNAYAPKYFYGDLGIKQNGLDGVYANQFLDNVKGKKTINKKEKNLNDVLWNADYQLTKIFYQGTTSHRDNLDYVINANRYLYPTERNFYSFPFISDETLIVKNREGKFITYNPYFYGYFKDLYFNVNKFINIVSSADVKTYVDVYKKIFEEINKAGGNFWDLALVQNDNTSKMIVVDKKMLPAGNDNNKPWYFDYQDSDSIMTGLSFKPKMSDAQAFRVVFGEINNVGSRTSVKGENDFLDYQFHDRILIKKNEKPPTRLTDKNSKMNAFKDEIRIQQHFASTHDQYQFTVMVGDQPFIRRLVLPDPELLNMLLDDKDFERNQRYTGIQPITVEVSLQGIGGLRIFMSFLIRNLPEPYNHRNVCYRITDVHHTIQDGKWNTIVKAGIIPLRGYIKQKLGIKE